MRFSLLDDSEVLLFLFSSGENFSSFSSFSNLPGQVGWSSLLILNLIFISHNPSLRCLVNEGGEMGEERSGEDVEEVGMQGGFRIHRKT